MIEPQHMLVEERGLESQIKRLKVLLMGKGFEQLNSIIEELENIKFSIKCENDRILKDKLKTKQLIRKEKMTTDPMLEIAKNMNDASRSSSNHGKLFLLRDIIMELDNLDLGVTSKAAIKTFLENKKDEIKKDIKRDSKFPDPFLDKL